MDQSTSVTTTTDRDWNGHNAATASSVSPDAEAWLDAHPHWADEPVSAVIRAGFSARDLDGLFDRLRPAPATVATAAGFIVQPDSLLMKSLCNADNGSSVDRGRYLVNAGV